MRRGWQVELLDGTVISEDQMEWKALPKSDIVTISLLYDGREWHFNNKTVYIQKKKASMSPGVAESFRVESRSIGYYDVIDGKSCKVWYTVNEDTGNMIMEVEEL